jgi:hypothetical protein
MMSDPRLFHRFIPYTRNSETLGVADLAEATESVKSAADEVLRRSCRCRTRPVPEFWGPFTPWTPPISRALVEEMHVLIARYAMLYRLSEAETEQVVAVAKRQSAATVPGSVAWFKKTIASGTRS